MSAIMLRLREYARLTNTLGAWGLLVSFWGVFLVAFAEHMAPRFGYLTGRPIGNDLPCNKPECDFSVFWPAGILARAHDYATLYSAPAFIRAVNTMLPPSPNIETFFYPPTMLLPVAAVSHLPFEWGAFAWMFGTLALAAAVLRLARVHWLVIAAGLFSPAALLNTEVAQLGALGGSLLLAGLLLAERRPALSGGLLGLLAAKPQIGLLVPAVYLAQRNWRGLSVFALWVLALAGASAWIFGPAAWRAYYMLGHAETARIMAAPFDPATSQGWGFSISGLLRTHRLGVQPALALQAICALAAAGALFWLRPRLPGPAFTEIAVYLSLLATPYGYSTDMVAYSLVLAEAARRRGWRIGMLDAVLWLWPGFCLVVSIATGVLLTPVFVLAALLRAALRARAAVLPPRPTGA